MAGGRYVFDIEGNGLLYDADTIWCVVLKDLDTTEVFTYKLDVGTQSPQDLLDGIHKLAYADLIIGHNITGYDIPLIQKLFPQYRDQFDKLLFENKVCDTLIISRLFAPDLQYPAKLKLLKGKSGGPHSLEAWGYRFGRYKVDHSDWTQLSNEMVHRCVEDTEITALLYNTLLKYNKDKKWDKALNIEYRVSSIITQQVLNGWKFNTEKALNLHNELDNKLNEIFEELKDLLKPTIEPNGKTQQKPLTQKGQISKRTLNHLGDQAIYVGGPYSPIKITQPDLDMLGSRQKIIKQLQRYGWTPVNYTEKGNPKLDEESLQSVDDPRVNKILEFYIIRQRKSQLMSGEYKGLIPNVRDDGRIEARANSQGTNTGRMRHSLVVNIPTCGVLYGKEIRELFTVPEGKVLIGTDASGLEARMEAHYTYPYDNGEYAERLLEGNIHEINMKVFNCDKKTAKAAKYALSYGCGVGKLSSILDISVGEAKNRYTDFWDTNFVLKHLKERLEKEYKDNKKKFITGIDGRRLYVRSEHSLVNLLFQSSGSIIMKLALCLLDKWVKEEGLDVKFVGNFHDEFQAEVLDDEETIKKYKELSIKSIVQAGEMFKLNVPLDAECQVGKTWADTH